MSGISSNDMTDEEMWQELYRFTGSKYAAAAIMGNFWAETHITSNNAENKINRNTGLSDEEYTAAIDDGSYTNFVQDKGGYGLAGWTYYTRKQALYDLAKETGCSIGSTKLQIYFLEQELSGHYSHVLENMRNASSLYDATVAFMHGYEGCSNQSDSNRDVRTGFAENYLNLYRDLAMAENALDLSDITLMMDIEQINDTCNNWASRVQSIDLSGIDVNGTFSPLTSVGVAESYIPSLKNTLVKAEELVLNTKETLFKTTEEQNTTDTELKQKNDTTSTGGNYYAGGGGSHGGSTSERPSSNVNNKKKKVAINTDFLNKVNTLDKNAFMGLMTPLIDIRSNFKQYLTDTNYASELKKKLLESPYLTDDLKEKILEMDPLELQVTLASILGNQQISDLSKDVISIFLENYDGNSFYKNVPEFFNTVNELLKSENLSNELLSIYDGNSTKDEETANLIRSIVDKISEENNMSYEDLLKEGNNNMLKDNLSAVGKDLSYFNVVNNLDSGTANTILTNAIK